jgi:hypothetical protein
MNQPEAEVGSQLEVETIDGLALPCAQWSSADQDLYEKYDGSERKAKSRGQASMWRAADGTSKCSVST